MNKIREMEQVMISFQVNILSIAKILLEINPGSSYENIGSIREKEHRINK